jgi:erythromycin esterase
MIGNATVVGLGEGTHGTREFSRMKHRIFEFLVERMGFTVFAFEANLPEAFAVNDYILTGKGDPKAALKGLYFWTSNTTEVLDLIEWMRQWNAEPRHAKKLKFYGVDMQFTPVAARNVIAALPAGDPARDALQPLLFRRHPYIHRRDQSARHIRR